MSNIEKLEAKYSPPNVNYWGDRCCRAEALLVEVERLTWKETTAENAIKEIRKLVSNA